MIYGFAKKALRGFVQHPYLVILSICFMLLSYPLYHTVYSWIKYSNGRLVVGISPDYKPYTYLDDQNRLVGFDIELGQALAQRLKKKLILRQLTKAELVPALKSGDVDVILNGLSITPQQLQDIDLIKYQDLTIKELSLIFWISIPHGFKKIDDFEQQDPRIVAIQNGSWYEAYLEKYPFIEPKLLNHSLDLVMAIKHKDCQAALVETDLARYLKHEYPKIRIFTVDLPESEWVSGKGIGIDRNNIVLKNAVEKVIHELKETMVLPALEYKWFGVYNRR